MLIKFTSSGRGGGGTVAAYLTDATRQGREHAAPEVIRGDMDRTRALIDSLSRRWTYTHGVLSFAPEDAPTEVEQHNAMDAFERVAFAGLDPEQFDITWVRHTHTGPGSGVDEAGRERRGGRVELHFVVPRVELTTGRALNIAPPGWERTFAPLRDALNLQHGWARPDDPERARELHGVPSRARTHEGLTLRAGREGVHAYVTALVAAGQVTDRASLVEALEGAGLSVPRQGKDYLTVADPKSGERLRMKGRLYEKGWSYDAELDRAAAGEAGHAVGRDRAPDHERAEAAWREVESRVRDRAQFHERLFARGARDRDAALERGPEQAQALGPLVVGGPGADLAHHGGAHSLVALALDEPERLEGNVVGDSIRHGGDRHVPDIPLRGAELSPSAGGDHGRDLSARRGAEAVSGAAHGRGAARATTGAGGWELEDGEPHALRARLARSVRELGERIRGLAQAVRGHGERALGLVQASWGTDRGHRAEAGGLERALGRLGLSLDHADAANTRLGRCREQVDGRVGEVVRAREAERVRQVEQERGRERTHSWGLSHGHDDGWGL
ncbi:hypothetical protein FHG66_20675 [Rubellimicrobium rubrum]|uniref:Relaxase n=1 Tax=Rubellimicrobium rubrum TaxID=2585369 RepID=A0A5C4MKU7_9RHOB|nr:relaxase/mobilization nuclease domain-containing protein [Rubellimicrobium rubrum]TNC44247.1 hypothetical protein FHG66_20675 [Rubellimicrobium rubrum]